MSATEAALHEAAALAHHLERSLLLARIERLSAVIHEHGLQTPATDPGLGASDGEHLEACRRVVLAAYSLLEGISELEAALTHLRTLVGSGMELVRSESWR